MGEETSEEDYYYITRWIELEPKIKLNRVIGVEIRTITKTPPRASGPIIKTTFKVPKNSLRVSMSL